MKEENKDLGQYIRVGTTLYKIVRRPLMSGDFIEERRVWNYETLRQDHSKDFISQVEKYDGFCSVPDHINYQRSIGTFLNQYEPIPCQPAQGKCPLTLEFLRHIFGEQFEMGLDYLQLLYLKPLTKLPIILLVSNERNTGKTTFLNFLKAIFAGNMTFNTNEDFHSQFNSDWANKLIVGVDEALLDRREDSERIKNLSTALSYKAEAKGRDRQEVEFFAKFVLCSNNEACPIIVEKGETRYWVRKIHPIEKKDTEMLYNLKREIPQFLYFLKNRELSTKKESRMWFRHDLLITDALRKIITHNRGKVENEMLTVISELMQIQGTKEYLFSVNDLFDVEEAKQTSIAELEQKEQDAKLRYEQAEEQKQQKESELKKTEENLSQAKGQLKSEELKNKAADIGSNIMDGIGSLVGTSKVKRQQQEIKNLKSENAGLQTEIKSLKEQIKTNEREHTKVADKLRQELDKIYALFPKIKELLRMENLCRHLGFGESLTKAILEMKSVAFKGKLYSSEYSRHFETEHSVAEIKPSINEQGRLRLTIDGVSDTNWFRQKYREFQESIGIKVKQKPEVGKSRGI